MSTIAAQIDHLERQLTDRGLSPDERREIRNSKICIIDDKIAQLQGMVGGLRREGFNNIVEFDRVRSVNEILEGNFDIVLLDLADIALEIDKEDGVGILQKLKEADPLLPVIVITGNSINPGLVKRVNRADLVSHKPVLSADLARDVEELVKSRKNARWGAVKILKELEKLSTTDTSMGLWDRWSLRRLKKKAVLAALDPHRDPSTDIVRMAEILGKYAGAIGAIAKLCLVFAK